MLDGSGQIQSVHGLFSDFVLRQRRVARLCWKKRIGKLSLKLLSDYLFYNRFLQEYSIDIFHDFRNMDERIKEKYKVDEFLQDSGKNIKSNAKDIEMSAIAAFAYLSNPETRVFIDKIGGYDPDLQSHREDLL